MKQNTKIAITNVKAHVIFQQNVNHALHWCHSPFHPVGTLSKLSVVQKEKHCYANMNVVKNYSVDTLVNNNVPIAKIEVIVNALLNFQFHVPLVINPSVIHVDPLKTTIQLVFIDFAITHAKNNWNAVIHAVEHVVHVQTRNHTMNAAFHAKSFSCVAVHAMEDTRARLKHVHHVKKTAK